MVLVLGKTAFLRRVKIPVLDDGLNKKKLVCASFLFKAHISL